MKDCWEIELQKTFTSNKLPKFFENSNVRISSFQTFFKIVKILKLQIFVLIWKTIKKC